MKALQKWDEIESAKMRLKLDQMHLAYMIPIISVAAQISPDLFYPIFTK